MPVTPLRVELRSENAAVAGAKDTASMNPYAAALFTQCDTEFQEEPTTALANADLMWSLLGTEVQYKCPFEEFSFREMNDSPIYSEFDTEISGKAEEDYSEDLYEEVYSTLQVSSDFEENVDVTTTYLGRYLTGGGPRTFAYENHILVDGKGVTHGQLFDETPFKIFFDNGAMKSYMAKSFYDKAKCLHKLPKLSPKCSGIKVGNGMVVKVLFIIPVQVIVQGHVFEIYTIVSPIYDGIDIVFGMKNMVEVEGILNMRTSTIDFLSRSSLIYPQHDLTIEPGGKAYVKFITPFPSNLTTRVITKFFGGKRVCTMKSRLKHNQGVVLFYNNEDKVVTLRHDNPIGIVDLRSIGYFRVSYQRLIAMAEQNFVLHHYKKMSPKPSSKIEESYMRMKDVAEEHSHRQ